mgnify:CR=1 FL=1
MQVVRIDSTESTNKYCEALDLAQVEDFTCYWALEQTAGIGQRGNHWEAAPGQNLTFSLVLHPSFLPADRQFKLTEALSLAIADFLATFRLQTPIRIKWPNDIYVGGKKLCGTLVSVRLAGGGIAAAVCGIGLNVNQRSFPDWVPNPTSLGLLSGRHYELEPLLGLLLECVWRRYDALREGADLEREYLDCLLNLDVQARYRYNGEVVVATITGVDRHGRLLLTAADGRRLVCGMKDIALLS